MPKTITKETLQRVEEVMQYIRERGCAETREIMRHFEKEKGYTESQIKRALELLYLRGAVREFYVGRRAIWCTPEKTPKSERVEAVKRALCRVIEGGRGRIICIKQNYLEPYIPESLLTTMVVGEITELVIEILKKHGVDYSMLYKTVRGNTARTKICVKREEISKICAEG